MFALGTIVKTKNPESHWREKSEYGVIMGYDYNTFGVKNSEGIPPIVYTLLFEDGKYGSWEENELELVEHFDLEKFLIDKIKMAKK